jgi:hypothetical protein
MIVRLVLPVVQSWLPRQLPFRTWLGRLSRSVEDLTRQLGKGLEPPAHLTLSDKRISAQSQKKCKSLSSFRAYLRIAIFVLVLVCMIISRASAQGHVSFDLAIVRTVMQSASQSSLFPVAHSEKQGPIIK